MALTRANLINQSDQILDSPQVENKIVLRTLPADPALNLTFSPAPSADRNVNFPDPGSPSDFVVYGNATQTLTNKTFTGVILTTPTITDFTNAQHDHSNAAGGGQFAHANLLLKNADDHTQYALLAGRSGGQILTGGTAASDPLTLRSTTNVTKGGILIDQDNVTLGSAKNINVSGGGELLGLPSTPSGASAAASKAYVDNQISILTGGAGVWKEDLLSASQLDNTNDAIAQAVAFFWDALPVNGDTFIITDGTNTETFTYSAVNAPFNPTTGGTAITAMTNLVSRINTDSAFWSATLVTTLQSTNTTNGNVIILRRKVPTSTVSDRIYGVTGTPNIGKYVNFGGQLDYRSRTVVNLPTVDPATATFGISRLTAALIPDEAHVVRAEDSVYLWNDDAGTWQLSGGAVTLATSGPGGGVIGQATFDSSLGLNVSAGVASVKVDSTSISFNGSGQLQVAGGAVPLGTSANNGVTGGATAGKVAGDALKGVNILGDGTMEVKVDGSTVQFTPSGQLKATPAAASPTGLVSKNIPFTSDIPSITAPTAGFISSDIPTLDYPDATTTGQLFDITVPDDYDSGNLEILAVYQMSGGTGNVRYQTQAKIVKISGSIDTASYPATGVTLLSPPTTPTRSVLFTISAANFAKGDVIQVYISRLGGDGADTSSATWRVIAFEYRYTAQAATRAAIQNLDMFADASVASPATLGLLGTDIPTLDFPSGSDTAEKTLFIIPDNWDTYSDANIRIDYAMSSAASGDMVRIETSGYIVDVSAGAVVALPAVNFDIFPSNDTNPHRTLVIRAIDAASLGAGDAVVLIIRRITTGLPFTNHPGFFKMVNATVALALAPTAGFTQSQIEEYYLDHTTFGNIVGPATVSGSIGYPTFGIGANDFATLYSLASVSSGTGEIDVAFSGRLASFQTTVYSVTIGALLSAGSPSMTLKIYFEGQASPVHTQVITPTGTYTEYTVNTNSFTQPTGKKRFIVVAEGHFTAVSSFGVSAPFVRVE